MKILVVCLVVGLLDGKELHHGGLGRSRTTASIKRRKNNSPFYPPLGLTTVFSNVFTGKVKTIRVEGRCITAGCASIAATFSSSQLTLSRRRRSLHGRDNLDFVFASLVSFKVGIHSQEESIVIKSVSLLGRI